MGHLATGEHKYRDLIPQVGCWMQDWGPWSEKKNVVKSEEIRTTWQARQNLLRTTMAKKQPVCCCCWWWWWWWWCATHNIKGNSPSWRRPSPGCWCCKMFVGIQTLCAELCTLSSLTSICQLDLMDGFHSVLIWRWTICIQNAVLTVMARLILNRPTKSIITQDGTYTITWNEENCVMLMRWSLLSPPGAI
jgi:hypothetical protein